MPQPSKPDCFSCKFQQTLPGDCHIACVNRRARVTGNPHGIKHGWFMWPYNFDPLWLVSCNGYQPKDAELIEEAAQ